MTEIGSKTADIQTNWWNGIKNSATATALNVKETVVKVCIVIDKVKGNPGALSKATAIVRHSFTSLTKLSRGLGHAEAVIDLFQVGGTIHFLATSKSIFDRKNLEELSFGVANAANALLWAQSHNREFLGAAAASVGNLLNAAVVVGFLGVAYSAYTKLDESNPEDVRIHNAFKFVWAVSEIALVILPALSLVAAPAWSAIVVVKLIGLATFLLEPEKKQNESKKVL